MGRGGLVQSFPCVLPTRGATDGATYPRRITFVSGLTTPDRCRRLTHARPIRRIAHLVGDSHSFSFEVAALALWSIRELNVEGKHPLHITRDHAMILQHDQTHPFSANDGPATPAALRDLAGEWQRHAGLSHRPCRPPDLLLLETPF